jgi:PadR family transcriptional regulator, regulatory protein PadR
MRVSHSGLRVLKACADQPGRRLYGYELMQITGLASGTLYPLLMRFEESGWLTSSWESADPIEKGRPRRRLYRITAAGSAALAEYLGTLGLGPST